MDLASALDTWRGMLGDAQVLPADAATQAYGSDTGGARRTLAGALRIRAAASLPEVMRIASRYQVSVYPISTGNNWGYGSALPARDGCVLLDLSGLQMILNFDADFGVVTLEPGVTQQMLADFLHAGDYPFLVPVTGAGPHCSLVGNALERGYGITPHADHFAAVTDLQAVLADGSVYRSALHEAGGAELARLFKWGIGPYSAGLFTQSGFGIVTRMSIVLARRPQVTMACLFQLKHDALLEPAVQAVHSLLARLPGVLGGINLMNLHRVLAMTVPLPSGASQGRISPELIAHMARQNQVAPWTGFASLYGTASTVAAARREMRGQLRGIASRMLFVTPQRANTLARVAARVPGQIGKRLQRMTQTLAHGLELLAGQPNETALALAYWRNPRVLPTTGPKHPARDGCGLLWYAPLVPMRAARVRAYVDMVHRVTERHGLEPLITLTSLNDRLFDSTVPLLFDRQQAAAVAAAQSCHHALLEEGRAQGCFPYRVGVDQMPWLSTATEAPSTTPTPAWAAAAQQKAIGVWRRLASCVRALSTLRVSQPVWSAMTSTARAPPFSSPTRPCLPSADRSPPCSTARSPPATRSAARSTA
jgi:FAD/FMN-containing dehydrogenase